MEHLYERVAYLKGLCKGLELSEETKEGKLLLEIIDILGDFSDSIALLQEDQDELEEYIEAVDEDLVMLEEDFYDLDDEDDEDFFDDDDYLNITCTGCGTEVEISGEDLADETLDIHCPECDEILVESVLDDADEE